MLSRLVSPRRRPLRVAFIALLATTGAFAGLTNVAAAQSAGTVLICEATGNPSAPYVEIRVNQADLVNYSAAEGDIIPAPATGCPSAAGSVAPTETSATATTTATTTPTSTTETSATSVTSTSSTATKNHTSGSGSVQDSSTTLAPTNPVVTAAITTATTDSTTETTTSALSTLPFTGGQVPLTLALALAALLGGGLLRWALIRSRPRPPGDRR